MNNAHEKKCEVLFDNGLIDLFKFNKDNVDISMIVKNLSRKNRFNDHTVEPYTVLQHSWILSNCSGLTGYSPEFCLYCLMHDFAEVYIGDITGPLKSLFPELCELEDTILDVICDYVGLQVEDYFKEHLASLEDKLLVLEMHNLMKHKYWSDDHVKYAMKIEHLSSSFIDAVYKYKTSFLIDDTYRQIEHWKTYRKPFCYINKSNTVD